MAPTTGGGPPTGSARKRGERIAQRELTAANLAHQRTQPYQARMPSGNERGAEKALPLGREGAVCALCGMPGHDADVCADRPAPKLRLSIDVSASQLVDPRASIDPLTAGGRGIAPRRDNGTLVRSLSAPGKLYKSHNTVD